MDRIGRIIISKLSKILKIQAIKPGLLDMLHLLINASTIDRMTRTPITPITICWVRMDLCWLLDMTFFFAITCSLPDSDLGSAYYKAMCVKIS